MEKTNKISDIERMAFLSACAAVLQISESLIPHPIPGVRLGLANMISLIVLYRMGLKAALEISLFRTLLASLILGTFLSPGFFLSLSGAMASTLVMGIGLRFLRINGRPVFSLVGISLFGAIAHNLTQWGLVYLLFIQNHGIAWLLPWMGISGIIMGWMTGLVAMSVCKKLETAGVLPNASPVDFSQPLPAHEPVEVPGVSPIHRLIPELKIIIILLFGVFLILSDNLVFYVGLCIASILLIGAAKISWKSWIRKLRFLSPIILFAFVLPVFFTTDAPAFFHWGPIWIAQAGMHQGLVFAFRLFVLMNSTFLLTKTTSVDELTRGTAWLLRPLRIIGLDGQRTAAVLAGAMNQIPALSGTTKLWAQHQFKTEKRMYRIIPAMGDLISTLFLQIEMTKPIHKEEI